MSKLILGAAALVAGLSCCVVAASTRAKDVPGWVAETQTYCMVPVLPETAARLHASVNGIWGGIGGPDPVLTNREVVPAVTARYGADARAFAGDCRGAGLVACSSVNGLEGFASLRAERPDLDRMACRDARGNAIRVDDGMTLMCTNNPDWVNWEIDRGKRGIDTGAECLLVDTPMSSSFISGILRGGFCQFCLANFKKRLSAKFTRADLRTRLGVADWDNHAVIQRLSARQALGTSGSTPGNAANPDALLFREFIECQEQASFDSRKRLVDTLREYARSRHRKVAFCTNAADLGTVNPGGHWIRGLMFADLFDFFAYELNPEPNGLISDQAMPYPRGKWAAYHRLAYAIHHRRAPAVIHAGAMGRLLQGVLQGKSINAWMEVQSAEAYAANGAYIQYYIEPQAGNRMLLERSWTGSSAHAAFVRAHRDLYDGDLRSGSPLAVLFLMNERGRTIPGVFPSYLGFAQGLTEGNYPYDVVFGGDGRYVRDRLSGSDLAGYRSLILPSPIEPTAGQKQIVRTFVRNGGTLVCQEPEKLGLSGKDTHFGPELPACVARRIGYGSGTVWVLRGNLTSSWTDDVGANFFRTYAPGLRTRISELAEALGLQSLVTGDTAATVAVFPRVQPREKRLIVHLVNYDIDYAADRVREKQAVQVSLPRPGFLSGMPAATVEVPGQPAQALAVSATKDRFSITVPRLGSTAAVVFSEK